MSKLRGLGDQTYRQMGLYDNDNNTDTIGIKCNTCEIVTYWKQHIEELSEAINPSVLIFLLQHVGLS